jgi:hypothetical protein
MYNEPQRRKLLSYCNFIFLFESYFLIVICYCIVIDLSYTMYNDPWRQNKSNQIKHAQSRSAFQMKHATQNCKPKNIGIYYLHIYFHLKCNLLHSYPSSSLHFARIWSSLDAILLKLLHCMSKLCIACECYIFQFK